MLKIIFGIFVVLFIISAIIFMYEAARAPVLGDYEEEI